MRLNHDDILERSRARGESLTALLKRAGVSRTAYYSLVRRDNILPGTVVALARALEAQELDVLADSPVPSVDNPRLARARAICAKYPEADFHNVWHTLTLLERSPLERLRGSLLRGRA
jgi:hypothetical protein